MYMNTGYIGLNVKNAQSRRAVMGLQGLFLDENGTKKSFFINEDKDNPILFVEDGKVFKTNFNFINSADELVYTMEGKESVNRYCFFVPDNFEGTILIPKERLIEYNNDSKVLERNITIESIGFHVVDGPLVIKSVFVVNKTQDKVKDAIEKYLNKELEKRITPFWEEKKNGKAIMYDESVALIERSGDVVYGKLLYTPTKILSVKDATLNIEYENGKDYIWAQGTNMIYLGYHSDIYYFTDDMMNGINPDKKMLNPSSSGVEILFNGEEFDGGTVTRFGNSLYVPHAWNSFNDYGSQLVSSILYSRQISVTYEYEIDKNTQNNVLYVGNEDVNTGKLEKVKNKLNNDEDLNVLFIGDSIFSGFDSSLTEYRRPFMPDMSTLVKDGLQMHTKGKIILDNVAVAGDTVEKAYNRVWKKFNEENKGEFYSKYDLLILSIGMNSPEMILKGDGTVSNYKDTVLGMIDMIRYKNPDMEVLLVSCMSPNKAVEEGSGSNWATKNMDGQGDVLIELIDEREGIAVVDFFEIHKSYLEVKDFIAMSSDNFRHPNDWLIRMYATNILEKIIR